MLDPDAKVCKCGREHSEIGPRCWYCERDWQDRKADYDEDQRKERTLERLAALRAVTKETS